MKKISRRLFVGAGATGAVAIASQLNGNGVANAQNGQINLYSSRHYNTDDELYDNFSRITGIKVNLIEGKADALIQRIKSEGRNSQADVLMTVDAGRLWRADSEGLFTPVNSQILNASIPASLRHPNGHWFGFSKRARVIMYNKNKVNPFELSTYEDLANSKWRNKIAIRSSSHIYNQSLVASLIEVYGEKETLRWCQGFVQNFARPPQGNDRAQIEAAAAGIAEIAIANTYYLPRYAKSNEQSKLAVYDQVKVHFPNQRDRGTHVNITGAGLVKTAPNREGGIRFLEYLASPFAQAFFAQGNNEYPVVEGTPVDPIVASFGLFKADDLNVASYGPNLPLAVKIMDQAGWR